MRFATIEIPSDEQPLDMSVIPLPTGPDEDEWVLANINRWRSQLTLPPISASELASRTKSVSSADGPLTLVDLQGTATDDSMNRSTPFSDNAPPRRPMSPSPLPERLAPLSAAARVPFTFEAPETWSLRDNDSMSVLAYSVESDAHQVRITVTPLAAAAAALAPNVNRWRRQIGLEPASEQDILGQTTILKSGDDEAQYVRLVGSHSGPNTQTILGAILVRGRTAWFLKLMGDSSLAETERARFEAFIRSISFSSTSEG